MTVIEAFLAGNDMECLQLTFEGFCMWFVVTVSLFGGINVGLHFTPKVSHYNFFRF